MDNTKFRIFDQKPLENYLQNQKQDIIKIFKDTPNDIFMNKSKKEHVENIFDKFSIDIPKLDFDNIKTEENEFNNVDIYQFKIPIIGDNLNYFTYKPNSRVLWSYEVNIIDHELCFSIIGDLSLNELQMKYNTIIQNIKQQIDYVDKVVKNYNDTLKKFIETEYTKKETKKQTRKHNIDSLKL